MCKVDVGRSLQNKFQPLTFKGETYFETYIDLAHVFLAIKMIPQWFKTAWLQVLQKGHLLLIYLGIAFPETYTI